MKENRQLNHLVIGKLGRATKSTIFKENEFKKELAPINSKTTCLEIAGEKYIQMTYSV